MTDFIDAGHRQPMLLPVDLSAWAPEDDRSGLMIETVGQMPMNPFQVRERSGGSPQSGRLPTRISRRGEQWSRIKKCAPGVFRR